MCLDRSVELLFSDQIALGCSRYLAVDGLELACPSTWKIAGVRNSLVNLVNSGEINLGDGEGNSFN